MGRKRPAVTDASLTLVGITVTLNLLLGGTGAARVHRDGSMRE
jgi:hypothetical protein